MIRDLVVVHIKNHSELFVSKDFQILSNESLIMKAEMPKLLKDEMYGVETVSNAVNVTLKVALVGSIILIPFFM